MTTKHTPGPWAVYDAGRSGVHVGTVGRKNRRWDYATVCNLFEDVADPYDVGSDHKALRNADADARLIAAAPDLLAALVECANALARYAHIDERADAAADAARAVIAKARGEAQP